VSRSKRFWSIIEDIVIGIERHPFIRGLTDGSLPMDSFKFYIVQDALFLKEFSRVLLLACLKADTEERRTKFLSYSTDVSRIEAELHASFLGEWGVDIGSQEICPTTMAYTSFLLSTGYSSSFPEILAAVVPCYWVYMHIGKLLLEKGSPIHEYLEWINTYGGEQYERGVKWMINQLDNVDVSRVIEDKMMYNFRMASIYEYMFWDSSYRRESFPYSMKTQ
jgi:thiaminase/transcriptional activator TenA